MTSYELRTSKDRTRCAFDNLERAREALHREQTRVGVQLHIVEVVKIERRVA